MVANCPAAPDHTNQGEPDPYNNSDPSKLRPFLTQCKLVFRSSSNAFEYDHHKIVYAVSLLTGTAQRWYELSLNEDDLPDYAHFWDDFEQALQSTFGEPDPAAATADKLDKLVMWDNHHITQYNIKFNEHASLTGFDERSLYAIYSTGLTTRIPDGFIYGGRPATLEALRNRAQEIDQRFWEHKEEERRKASVISYSSSKSSSSQAAFTSTSSQPKPNNTHNHPSSRGNTPSAPARPRGPDLSPEVSEESSNEGSASDAESSDPKIRYPNPLTGFRLHTLLDRIGNRVNLALISEEEEGMNTN